MFKWIIILTGLICMVGCSFNPMFGEVEGKCDIYVSCNGSPRTLERTIVATKCDCEEAIVNTGNCQTSIEWSK